MNFGEKLTNLRKQKGLSQEELGFELNVTRQTVSKWELGQTTPEMEKLIEMSKIFGVSLDELTNENEIVNNEVEKIEDRPINDKPQKNSTLKVILLIFAIFVIVGAIMYGFVFSKIFSFGKGVLDRSREIREQATEITNRVSGAIEQQVENNEMEEELDQMKETVLEIIDEAEKEISKTEEIKEQVNEQKENTKEQTTSKENIEQAQQEQQQMVQQYQQQEQQVNEQMDKIKEQMSPE